MVQVFKQILQKILCKQKHVYKELLTFLWKVEGIINSCLLISHEGNIDVIMSSHLALGRLLQTHIDATKIYDPTEENITEVYDI